MRIKQISDAASVAASLGFLAAGGFDFETAGASWAWTYVQIGLGVSITLAVVSMGTRIAASIAARKRPSGAAEQIALDGTAEWS